MTKILAIGAHPDDIEFYAGGTLAKRVEEGDEVVFVVTTDGSAGSYDGKNPNKTALIRKKEQDLAAKKIGAKKVVYLNFTDGHLEFNLKKLKQYLLQVLLEERPEIIFTFDPQKQHILHEDFHPDHRTLALAVIDLIMIDATLPVKARIPLKKPQLFLYNPHQANTIIDISRYLPKKEAALKVFKSQILNLVGYDTCFERFQVYTSR